MKTARRRTLEGDGLKETKRRRGPQLPFDLLLAGLFLSLLVAVPAFRLGALTGGGATAAVVIGTIVFGLGGWAHAGLLVAFFASSSLLTRWHRERKGHPEHRTGRTAPQVLANGIVAAGLATLWSQIPVPPVAAGFVAAVAAATADTWATEVGLLSPTPPRLITTGRRVSPGHSGGVTWLGTLAALAGAGLIAAGGHWWLGVPVWIPWLAGTAGMLLDSVLGATIEGRARGVTNDTVNLLATLVAAVTGVGLTSLR